MDRKIELVAEYVTSAVPTAQAMETVHEIVERLPGRRHDTIQSVYVVDDDRMLVGSAPLVDLYAAPQESRLRDLMRSNPPSVRADLDREEAVSLAIREQLVAVPVVDETGHFLGVFPPRAIMQVLREEHLEDLHHMAGIWHHTDAARQALQAPTLTRVRYRLPWLIVGLTGAMIAAAIVAQFEHTLQTQIAVAYFIPTIVYLADAVGTQSEAVAVRGLSLTDVGIGRLLLGEISAGVLMGSILAILAGAVAVAAFGQLDLAFVVAISLLGACGIATAVGLALPWAFARADWDPALASGPIGTIIQDVLSLLIYFTAATIVL
jgi:magnesium transporter